MITAIKTYCQYFLPHHFLSRLTGITSNCKTPWFKHFAITWFIKRYGVDMSCAENPDPRYYTCFNHFFTRALKPDARPIAADSNALASPVDGFVSQIGDIKDDQIFQAKGHYYSLDTILGGDNSHVASFQNGKFATLYLAPKNYHRIHIPFAGKLKKMIYVPGRLFSVSPHAVNTIENVFARNERLVCLFDTEIGPMAIILVGALFVGSIETTWVGIVAPPRKKAVEQWEFPEHTPFNKGDEIGRFQLGSTVIMLFGKEALEWSAKLSVDSPLKMGEAIGRVS